MIILPDRNICLASADEEYLKDWTYEILRGWNVRSAINEIGRLNPG